MQEGITAFSGIVAIFLLIVAVLAFLMPFFIFRIRNELISMNQKMTDLIKLLGGKPNLRSTGNLAKRIKHCSHCGTKNRVEDTACMNCGKMI